MDEQANLFTTYFAPPVGYFWRWAENAQVIEWKESTTIVYRQDLIYLLNNLSRTGWPPLGAVTFVLLACRDDWKTTRDHLLTGKLDFVKRAKDGSKSGLREASDLMNDSFPVLEETLALLDRVAALEAVHRTGPKRILLLQVLFEGAPKVVENAAARLLLNDLGEGSMNGLLKENKAVLFSDIFRTEMDAFVYARNNFVSTEQLRNKLLTGITVPPEPAVPELKEEELPPPTSADLLDQLSSDPRTYGMTKLTRRLIAALQIPMYAQGSSDQSFGGVSDITNRGDFDRLLLSELANEDDALVARLANNEALFLRREELPSTIDYQRYILVDTTIKLWGIPRLFAISAALACARKRKAETALHTFVLGGTTALPVDLETKEGVMESLMQLDPALHCGVSLVAFMEQQQPKAADEYFFITSDEVYNSPDFLPSLSAVQAALRYIITVDRIGGMVFYQLHGGRRKLLSTTQFDLNELLFAKPPAGSPAVVNKKTTEVSSMVDLANPPAVLLAQPFPFYWPAIKLKLKREKVVHSGVHGVFAISNDQRVLHWPSGKTGAVELLDYIEPGHYALVLHENTLHLLVKSNKSDVLKMYGIDIQSHRVFVNDLSTQLREDISDIEPGNLCFVIHAGKKKYTVNLVSNDLVDISDDPQLLKVARNISWNYDVQQVKKHVNSGFTAVGKVGYIGINQNRKIVIDGRVLQARGERNTGLYFDNTDKSPVTIYARGGQELLVNSRNQYVKLFEFVFDKGDRIYVDSRGMLHFVPVDAEKAQFSIIHILDQDVAAWASNGAVSGASYFLINATNKMAANDFNFRYLTAFIDNLF